MPLQPKAPLLVYVDVDVLVFWILPQSHLPGRGPATHAESRKEVTKLFDIFKRHTGPANNIEVITCQWSLIEAHSVLYRDALWLNNQVPSNRRNRPRYDPRREVFPPHAPSLQQATAQLSAAMHQMATLVSLTILTPDARLWQTALSVSEQCGIYAPDAIHLATAIQAGCDMIVTGDIDFVNKTHAMAQAGAITQISAGLLPVGTPPPLEACPLRPSQRLRNPRLTARQYLSQLGYR